MASWIGQPSHMGPRTFHELRSASPSSTKSPLRVPTRRATRSDMSANLRGAGREGDGPACPLIYPQPTPQRGGRAAVSLGRLEYLYMPSGDVAADLRYFVEVLGAMFGFAIE